MPSPPFCRFRHPPQRVLFQQTLQPSIEVPLPSVPQLAGLPVALQYGNAPTRGAPGFDLSNGLWACAGL